MLAPLMLPMVPSSPLAVPRRGPISVQHARPLPALHAAVVSSGLDSHRTIRRVFGGRCIDAVETLAFSAPATNEWLAASTYRGRLAPGGSTRAHALSAALTPFEPSRNETNFSAPGCVLGSLCHYPGRKINRSEPGISRFYRVEAANIEVPALYLPHQRFLTSPVGIGRRLFSTIHGPWMLCRRSGY
jgi:hypothetical protein